MLKPLALIIIFLLSVGSSQAQFTPPSMLAAIHQSGGTCMGITAPTGGIFQSTNLSGSSTDGNGDLLTLNDAVSPDCTSDASTFKEGNTDQYHAVGLNDGSISGPFSGVPITISVYVKQGTGTRNMYISLQDSSYVSSVTVDATNGTIVTGSCGFAVCSNFPGATGTAKVIPGPVGFYQVLLNTSTVTDSSVDMQVFNATGNTVYYTGDNSSSLIYWGAQLSECALIPPPSGGLYNNLNMAGGVLDSGNPTLVLNNVLSPDCSNPNDASTFTEGTTDGYQAIGFGPIPNSAISDAPVTVSFYANGGSGDRNVELDLLDQTFGSDGDSYIVVNPATCALVTGPVTTYSGASVTYNLASVGPGFCHVTMTTSALTASALYPDLFLNDAGTTYYTGNGTSHLGLWGFQISECSLNSPPSGGIYNNTNMAGVALQGGNPTLNLNSVLSPDCQTPNDASIFTEGTTNGYQGFGVGPIPYSAGGSVTMSVYANAGSGDRDVEMDLLDQTFGADGDSYIVVNPATCAVVGTPGTTYAGSSLSYSLTPVGPGFCYITMTTNPLSGTTALYPDIFLNNGATGFYQGNGTSNFALWGLSITSP